MKSQNHVALALDHASILEFDDLVVCNHSDHAALDLGVLLYKKGLKRCRLTYEIPIYLFIAQ